MEHSFFYCWGEKVGMFERDLGCGVWNIGAMVDRCIRKISAQAFVEVCYLICGRQGDIIDGVWICVLLNC